MKSLEEIIKDEAHVFAAGGIPGNYIKNHQPIKYDARFNGYIAGRSQNLAREKEYREALEGIVEFCNEQIAISMKEYGKTKDKVIENMCATECMTYGIIRDKASKPLNP